MKVRQLQNRYFEKIKYVFDNVMSKGILPSVVLLLVVSFLIVLFFATILLVLNIHPEGDSDLGFLETLWISGMRTLDPGNMGDDRGWPYRIVMLLVTGYGIVMLSTFIGLMSNGILRKAIELRKGRSKVLENNHILILGWSSKISTVISELIIANENQLKPVIVILADRDKVDMEDEVRDNVPNTKNTKLIFRSGNPIDINDLKIASPHKAKSIIVLGSKSDNSDAEIIKVILAITKTLNGANAKFHIVAEIENKKNLEVAKMIGRDNVELILSNEFVSRILVQTSRQAGLSIVYTDLLDFDGDEIYFSEEPKLNGKTFREALFSYDKSTLIGVHTKKNGVMLNPPIDTVIEEGSQVITISEDDDKVIYSGINNKINENLIRGVPLLGVHHENILILGWNLRAKIIIRELASYTRTTGKITVIAELKNMDKTIARLNEQCPNTEITYTRANTADKNVLEDIDMTTYDHLIILSYQDNYEMQQADAKTLITLLHLRNIAELRGMNLNVVSEMLDAKNRDLATVTEVDDFIISDNMVSLIISQVAENKFLMKVFDQLFKSEGNEIYLKPAENYIEIGKEVDFYTILESSVRMNEIAIGYRLMDNFQDVDKNFGIVLNPDKRELVSFSKSDLIIVLSAD
jgi:Trk K+ transport system NAD-binding subunit